MNIFKKIIRILALISVIFLIGAVAFGISWWLQLWEGYPRGADGVSHIFRANQIIQFWPHFIWFHSWSGGTPHFFWYPSLTYLVLAAVNVISHQPLDLLLSAWGLFSVALVALGVFLLVNELTGVFLLSFACSLICLVTPGSWAAVFSMGGYNRTITIAFLGLALWAAVRWLKRNSEGQPERLSYFLTVVFLGFSFLAHYNGGPQAFFVIFVLLLFALRDWPSRILQIIKVFIPAALLTSVLSFPMIILKSPSTSFTAGHVSYNFSDMFLSFNSLFYFLTAVNIRGNDVGLFRLSPLLLPLLLVLVLALVLVKKGVFRKGDFLMRLFWALGLVSILFLIYGTVKLPFIKFYGAGIFDPRMIIFFVPSFLAPMIGIATFKLFEKRILQEMVGFILIVLTIAWFFIQFPFVGIPKFTSVPQLKQLGLPVEPNPSEFNFRWGTGNYSNIASLFNYLYPNVPQTRDYFATGVVVPDYYIYLVLAGWRWGDNYQETNFLFDWWAVKDFVVMKNETWVEGDPLTKFKKDPEDYLLKGDNEVWSVFEYAQPSPIMAAVNTPSLLVIGSEKSKAYNLIFRSLSQSDLNSKYLIPIHGREYIDDYQIEELEKFPIIFISDYQYHHFDQAASLLEKYVRDGGGLLIESSKEMETETSKSKILPDPWPIEVVGKTDFGKQWFLTKKDDSEIVTEINLENFAPAVFDDGPWGIAFSEKIKNWAKTILTDKDKPVLVAGELGSGRVVWSGMNFPYHITTYKNSEESRLLGKIIAWLGNKNELTPETSLAYQEGPSSGKSLFFETSGYQVEFVHPEKRVITLKAATRGVLFKEAYFPGWKAYLNDKQISIYKAGPDFMYIPLSGSNSGDKITLKFTLPSIVVVGAGISLLTFIFLIYYLLGGKIKLPFPKMADQKPKLFFKKLTGWWEEE